MHAHAVSQWSLLLTSDLSSGIYETPLQLYLELELMQTYMAQKPVLRVEVGARALRVRSVSVVPKF